MTWEWSHSQEGYDNVRANIRALNDRELQNIYTEIVVYRLCREQERLVCEALDEEFDEHPVDSDDFYNTELGSRVFNSKLLERLLDDHESSVEETTELSEFIWAFAQEHRECSNGGHLAYVCPYNCHSVSFGGADDVTD